MKFAYQRQGGPIITWRRGSIPRQSRAGETKSLGCAPCAAMLGMGSLEGTTLDHPTLPAPGAPEPIGVARRPMSGIDCKCGGTCGCSGGVGDIVDSIPGGYITVALGAAAALWLVLKRR